MFPAHLAQQEDDRRAGSDEDGENDGNYGDALEEQEELPEPGTRGYISYSSGLALRSRGVLPTTSTPRRGRQARRRW